MTEFQNRPLTALQRIWNFVGGLEPTSLRRMALAGDIIPVADLQRMAELGRGHGRNEGLYILRMVNTHVGTGDIIETLDIFNPANTFGSYTRVDPTQEWIWLMATWGGVTDTTDFGSASLFLDAGIGGGNFTLLGAFEPSGAGAGSSPAGPRLVASWGATNLDGLLVHGDGAALSEVGTVLYLPQPFMIPFAQGVFNMRTTAIASGTIAIAVHAMIWRGPIGARPPGIA